MAAEGEMTLLKGEIHISIIGDDKDAASGLWNVFAAVVENATFRLEDIATKERGWCCRQ